MELLQQLCSIFAPSGEEWRMKEFLLWYVKTNMCNWKTTPVIYNDLALQDSVMLVFGKPRTALFAHVDSTGFTARYNNELVPIGGPACKDNDNIVYYYNNILNVTKIKIDNNTEKIYCTEKRTLEPGTTFTYKPYFKIVNNKIFSPYLDNRLGVWTLLNVAKTLENGIIVFSCYEEHGGGSIEKLSKIIYNKFNITQALIADITWATEGIFVNNGVVVSLRDKYIPRFKYVEKIRNILNKNNFKYQTEVEQSGSSDGGYLQKCHEPIDWCFIGVAEENNHSSIESVSVNDSVLMIKAYELLMKEM